MSKTVFIFSVIFITAIAFCGCGKSEGDEPTKYRSQEGLKELTRQAQASVTQSKTSKNASENRAFNASKSVEGKAPEVRDLDRVIGPVLKKLFGDAKIIEESKSAQTQRDQEVLENRFAYVVKKNLIPKDGESLHAALRAAGFGASPRLGSKPTIWSGGAAMSLFESTSLRSYSIVIKVDTKKQQIVVESYKLGSKYDRLM